MPPKISNYDNIPFKIPEQISQSRYICYRPSGASVPVYDDDSARDKRKVQRVTSPEKWEIKQVSQCIFSMYIMIKCCLTFGGLFKNRIAL